MNMPIAITKQAETNEAVASVVQQLRPDVIHIRYDLGGDWSGDWAIYSRVVLSDEASSKEVA
jgi:hypothetical protein